jgi:hypothetical protein
MTHTKLLAALVALMLIACGSPLAPEAEDVPTSTTAELKACGAKVAPAGWQAQVSATSTRPIFSSSFAISSASDLFFAFDTSGALAGQHQATFEVTSPDGAMYQRKQVPFVPGSSTHTRVWSSMPIAGTWIQQFAMTGTWTVKVFLDAEANARATKAFVLQ